MPSAIPLDLPRHTAPTQTLGLHAGAGFVGHWDVWRSRRPSHRVTYHCNRARRVFNLILEGQLRDHDFWVPLMREVLPPPQCQCMHRRRRLRLQAARKTTIYELELDGAEDSAFPAIRSTLDSNSMRQLLGPETAITLTSHGFLIHHARDEPWGITPDERSRMTPSRSARVAVGDCQWSIRGVNGQVHLLQTEARGHCADHQELERSLMSGSEIEQAIKSIAKITAKIEVLAWPPSAQLGKREDVEGNDVEGRRSKCLLRLFARIRANVALALDPVPAEASARNPLLGIGMRRLLSDVDCDRILCEATSSSVWSRWSGDLGEDSTAVPLEGLAGARALWEGAAGATVRSHIARVYEVQPNCVICAPRSVFVCRIAATPEPSDERLTQDSPEAKELSVLPGSSFRRSSSLITFSIALSAQAEGAPTWAVCLEQQGQTVLPIAQGAGVVFSGKLRHATTVGYRSEHRFLPEGDQHEPLFLIRGFAELSHPPVREKVIHSAWGHPAWHLDAPYVRDEDILDRCAIIHRFSDFSRAAGSREAVAAPAEGSRAASRIQRMNSTSAHRYYQQGLEGMDVPVLDERHRPVVDLVEERRRKAWDPRPDEVGEVTITAFLRTKKPWDRRRRVIGKVGLSTSAGTSPLMDAALQKMFGAAQDMEGSTPNVEGASVPPIKYVFVDPRFRGFGLGRRLFVEAMCSLAARGFRFALIIVEDNGSGGLFDFYEDIGFVRADEVLGVPRAMIAPIPPTEDILRKAA